MFFHLFTNIAFFLLLNKPSNSSTICNNQFLLGNKEREIKFDLQMPCKNYVDLLHNDVSL